MVQIFQTFERAPAYSVSWIPNEPVSDIQKEITNYDKTISLSRWVNTYQTIVLSGNIFPNLPLNLLIYQIVAPIVKDKIIIFLLCMGFYGHVKIGKISKIEHKEISQSERFN